MSLSTDVIDLGAGANPDPRATLTADIRDGVDVDYRFDLLDEWPLDNDSVVGIICSHVLEHFEIDEVTHVFQEAGRVLSSGGWLELRVPLGANYRSDHSHQPPVWTWKTLETLSETHRRGWDPNVPFRLTERRVRMWPVRPFGFVGPFMTAVQSVIGDGLWSTELANAPLMSGELIARYQVRAATSETIENG